MSLQSGTVAQSNDRVAVLVDGYFIDRQYGFGRYVREMIRAIDLFAPKVRLTVVVPPRGETQARELIRNGEILVKPERIFPVWEQATVPRAAREVGAELVHFPYQTVSLAWPRKRSVMTLHDLIHLGRMPQNVSRMDQFAHIYRRVDWLAGAKRAGDIIAVSDATAQEAAQLGLTSTVVPNIVDGFVSSHPHDGSEDTSRYFLHRGGDAGHKNTPRVIEAFLAVQQDHPDIQLRIFGLGATGGALSHLASPGVTFLSGLDDAALARLYRGARAVVIPSLKEGFGLAIIEAFGFGAPVITSNRPPMSDLTAYGAGLQVDPLSVTELADAMRVVLEDQTRVDTLRSAASRRYEAYGAASVGQRLQEIYLERARG